MLVTAACLPANATTGTESASFLDIPVGAEPAAVGSAYTAQAMNAYAAVWNPAGLGLVDAIEVSGTHLAYLESVHYDFLGAAIPLFGRADDDADDDHARRGGIGAAVQYLGSGDITSYNDQGLQAGSFSTSFAAYSLAYGQSVTDHLALGLSGRVIRQTLSDVSANAYAADLGALYKAAENFYIGTTVANLGSSVKFVRESDPLPLAGRLGALWQALPSLDISLEGVYRKTGLFSGHVGAEWRYQNLFALRGGYDSTHTKDLSGAAGLTAGLGIYFWGQEFAYAYVPYSNLGNTHYFTLTLRFSKSPPALRIKSVTQSPREPKSLASEHQSNYDTIYQVLTDDETTAAQHPGASGHGKKAAR